MFETCAKTEVVKNKTVITELWSLFCNSKYPNATCDEYFNLNNLTELRAIPGLLSGVIKGEKENRKYSEGFSMKLKSSITIISSFATFKLND